MASPVSLKLFLPPGTMKDKAYQSTQSSGAGFWGEVEGSGSYQGAWDGSGDEK